MRSQKKSKPRRPAKKTATQEFEQLLQKTSRGRRYVLQLFVTGSSPRSALAIANIRALCEEHLHGRYDLEVVDIYQQPAVAAIEQIVAAPTLVKKLPWPLKRIVGDLADRDRVVVGLNLRDGPPGSKLQDTKWAEV